ncbi:tripartite tricarboxylate transporter TctB family protein [Gemmobacter serpentinus]|uniref:tripartite tricarboxylate transporter TctB family protein n=1 Tax=Gemmobacter serpentinus TaxID=2652247 RepID=UPI00124E4895|nr:tripartite tricarboxylate transporter TctB family protein [Gemmobacter serpentinus]
MTSPTTDRSEAIAGALLMLAAGFFAWQTMDLRIGTALRMGPGYFPAILSGILFLLGLLVFLKAFRSTATSEAMGAIAWRGLLFILPAPVFFGLTVRGLGFVPALFLTALIAAMASMRMKLHWALLLAFLVTLFSTLVFSYALGLPFRRFGPWLPF